MKALNEIALHEMAAPQGPLSEAINSQGTADTAEVYMSPKRMNAADHESTIYQQRAMPYAWDEYSGDGIRAKRHCGAK